MMGHKIGFYREITGKLSLNYPVTHSYLDHCALYYEYLNSISVISGRCVDDNERLCAMELHYG